MLPSTPARVFCFRSLSVLLLIVAAVVSASPAAAAPQTTLSLTSEPGDYVGAGLNYFYTTSHGSFTASRNARNGITITFTTTFGATWRMEFAAPGNVPLQPGVWLDAVSYGSGDASRAGIAASGFNRSCSSATGSFQVKQVTYGLSGNVTAFWVTFAQQCNGSTSSLLGDLRYRAELPVSVVAPPVLTVVRGSEVFFNVQGGAIGTGPVLLSTGSLPTGAQFVDNGDRTGSFDWFTAPSQVGDHLITFYAENGTGAIDSALTVVHVTGLSGLRADSDPGDPVGGGSIVDLSGDAAAYQVTENGGVVVTVTTPGQSDVWTLAFSAADGAALGTGVYLNAGPYAAPGAGRPGLAVSLNGQTCENLAGEFEVKELVRGTSGITSFRAFFDQRCGGSGPGLRGEVRFNAAVPIDIVAPFGMTVDPGQEILFFVIANDPWWSPLQLTVDNLPSGATFVDNGDNSATFRWTPGLADGGMKRVVFTASNGVTAETATTRILVESPAAPPVAHAGGPYAGETAAAIAFDGTDSSTPFGTLVSATWDFGDGGTASGLSASHSYAAPGKYDVVLTVCNEAYCDVDSTTAVVTSPPPPPAPSEPVSRAFAGPGSNPVRLNSGKPEYSLYLEPLAGTWDVNTIDPSTLELVSPGTGWVDRIRAAVAPTPGDRDHNKVEDVEAVFTAGDLRQLFSGVNGQTELKVSLEARLKTGEALKADLNLEVFGDAGKLDNLRARTSGREISFVLVEPSFVTAALFDANGRHVATLMEQDLSAGEHMVTAGAARGLSPGIYFYRITSAVGQAAGRVVVMR